MIIFFPENLLNDLISFKDQPDFPKNLSSLKLRPKCESLQRGYGFFYKKYDEDFKKVATQLLAKFDIKIEKK